MALDKLDFLYQQVIFDHVKNPHHKGQLKNPTHHMQLLNPSCGDLILVELRVEDDQIAEIGFIGHGCSISMASASMMTDALLGRQLQEVSAIVDNFDYHIGGPEPAASELMDEGTLEKYIGDAILLAGVKRFPARYKCASLAWKAAELGLYPEEKEEKMSQGLKMIQNEEI